MSSGIVRGTLRRPERNNAPRGASESAGAIERNDGVESVQSLEFVRVGIDTASCTAAQGSESIEERPRSVPSETE
ncbi:hypothetical protein EA462_14045 [Natrarchaeobius halalkaliphilus]|uniref:Uncharacterized protein n=1 Tax=Natrarchaeobius halalkaliphilus TaxID=1679091 RepID=A0A3N6MT65_9EURY|nr:hypothetical protein EA462_14045 [Natrarchaeobius halalkaliphilus]